MKSIYTLISLAVLFMAPSLQAQIDVDIQLVEFASGFNNPTDLTHAGDERLFVVEQNGLIRILLPDGTVNATNFLNMTTLTTGGGERGLLGLAFHPDYAENGSFYVNYTQPNGDTRISHFTVSANPDVADFNSRIDILTIDQPYSNHNGGCLRFGPDGYLYIGMGDGGSGEDPLNSGQTMSSLLGKMLRIDINTGAPYGIPEDNPFVGSSSDTLPEIWASGIRNPWRFSSDSETGDLWIGDVGQYSWEEIDFQAADSPGGENYGWRCYEGNHNGFGGVCPPMSAFTGPVTEYSHASGACSVTGGYVYRGSEYPNLYGKYFFCDYCNGKFYSLEKNDLGQWVRFDVTGNIGGGWSCFGEDVNGALYLVNQGSDKVFKITDPCSSAAAEITQAGNTLTATAGISYQWYLNGNAIVGGTMQTFTADESGTYTVLVVFSGNCTDFAEPIEVTVSGLTENDLVPTRLNLNPIENELQVIFGNDMNGRVDLNIYDVSGRTVAEESLTIQEGMNFKMDATSWTSGNYVIRLQGINGSMTLNFVKE